MAKNFEVKIDGLKEVEALLKDLPRQVSEKAVYDLNMKAGKIIAKGLSADAPEGNNAKKHKEKIGANTMVTKGNTPTSVWIGFKKRVFYVLFIDLGTRLRKTLGKGRYKSGANRGQVTAQHWVEQSHEKHAGEALKFLQDNFLAIINNSIKKQLKNTK